ncbi:MAG: hypothetical protein ACP5PM_00425 [Acidimicrobiales bacterium]
MERRPLTAMSGRWRSWGSGGLAHWWNFDTKRPPKQVALVVDPGKRVMPVTTPDDPDAVDRILAAHRG